MALETLKIPALGALAEDGLFVQSVRPVELSGDGRFTLTEVVVSVPSGARSVWLVQDTETGAVVMDLDDVFRENGIASVDIDDVSVSWGPGGPIRVAVGYADLSDQFTGGVSGANRVAVWDSSGLYPEVLFESPDDIANGSVSAVQVLDNRYLVVETSAFNLNPLSLDDNNGISDLYLVDLSGESAPVWVTSQGGVAPSHPSVLLGASVSGDTVEVVFETESSGFSSFDSNEDPDIYRAVVVPGSAVSFELLTASVSDRSATGVSGSVSVLDNGTLFVATDGSAYELGYESGHQEIVAIELETGVATVVSANLPGLGTETEFYPGPVSPSGGVLAVVVGSGNESLDGQVIEIDPDLSGHRVVSVLGGQVGNDLSYNLAASDGERGGSVIAFQTSASNLGVLPNLAVLEAEFVDFAGAGLFFWDGLGVFSETASAVGFGSVLISSEGGAYASLGLEQPADYLNLMDWVDSTSVSLRAEVSSPGEISVSDIVSSIEAYLGLGDLSLTAFAAADINGDGAVMVSDIVSSIEIYLGISDLEGVVQFVDAETGQRELSLVVGETLDLAAVLLGDVDGSWSPEIV